MNSKRILQMWLAVIMLAMVFSPSARAIYIPDDTSIGTWDPVNRIYTLNTDVFAPIEIVAGYFTLDGAGYSVKGAGGENGVYLRGKHHVTIMNLNVQGWRYGIYLYESGNCTLTGNTASNNSIVGIFLRRSGSCSLTGNNASNNWIGISIGASSSCGLTGNTMSGNTYNFQIWSEMYQEVDTTNTVDSKPIWYLKNVHGGVYGSWTNAGVFYAIDCSNLTIEDLTLTNNSTGITLINTPSSTIRNVTTSNNEYGIGIWSSSGCTVTGNNASKNYTGIDLGFSDSCTVTDNTASKNDVGIEVYRSDSCILTGNTTNSNLVGIKLTYCTACIPTGNTASDNLSCGISLFDSSSCTLTDNVIWNNAGGILIWDASDCQIYHNNFVDNAMQARAVFGSGNVFNLDAPIGGNYWSNHTSPDDNGDGFVDTPYIFTGGQDNLPWTVQDGWLTPAPEVLIQQLIAKVESLNLHQGIDNSLDSKLENVLAALEAANAGQRKDAVNKMQAFISAVEAQSGKAITEADEEALKATAQSIIDLLMTE